MQLAGPRVWGHPDHPGNAVAVLREAVTLGVNFFDAANAYGPRTVNQLIAAALHPYPDGLIVGNKVGADRGPDRSWLTDNRPETLRRQVHEALADLRVEASELTYLRMGGDGQAALSDVPLEDSLGALVELRDQGLIRRIGLSGANPGQLRRARAMTPIAAVENRYNLLDRSGVQVLVLVDEMFPMAAAELLRTTYGHDAAHVAEVGLRATADAQVAAAARAENRAVVTGNAADFAAERDPVLVFVLEKNLRRGADKRAPWEESSTAGRRTTRTPTSVPTGHEWTKQRSHTAGRTIAA